MIRPGRSLLVLLALLAAACSSDSASATESPATDSPSTTFPSTLASTTIVSPTTAVPTTTTTPCAVPEAGPDTMRFQSRDRSYEIVTPDTINEGTPLLLLLH